MLVKYLHKRYIHLYEDINMILYQVDFPLIVFMSTKVFYIKNKFALVASLSVHKFEQENQRILPEDTTKKIPLEDATIENHQRVRPKNATRGYHPRK